MKIPGIPHNLVCKLLILLIPAIPAVAEPPETEVEDRVQVRDVEVVVPASPSPLPRSEAIGQERLAQSFEGKLLPARNRMLFFRPPHPYQLNDSQGNRIAWVNLENAIYTGSVGNYLQKEVVVHGVLRTPDDDSLRNNVLDVKNLRLR
jgi:hypothetical protein